MEKELNRLSELALALAKSKGFESVSLYVNSHWNGYLVFEAKPLPTPLEYYPLILVKNEDVRWANDIEEDSIVILYQ